VHDFLRDHQSVARLIERFVYHFLRKERSDFEVKSDVIRWDGASIGDPMMEDLLTMRTDICLHSPNPNLVVDAKYDAETLGERLGHRVRICTVDLSRNWQEIDAELKALE
jgi:5-methylcytosine-specific restriction endonuclease McrBC regulatory subunit McrC